MLAPELRTDLVHPDTAERELCEALESGDGLTDRAFVAALYRRGRVRRERHAFDSALLDFRQALAGLKVFGADDSAQPLWLNRATICLETARVYMLEEEHVLAHLALDYAEQEAMAMPDYANWSDIHLERARLFVLEDDLDAAEERLLAAVDAVGSSVLDVDLNTLYLELGIIRAQQGDLDEALCCLEAAVQGSEPGSTTWLRVTMALGDVLWLRGDFAQALRHYHIAHRSLDDSTEQSDRLLDGAKQRARACLDRGHDRFQDVCGDLVEGLFEAAMDRDGEAIFDWTRLLAFVAMALDAYPRVSALVETMPCQVASASLAYHMLELAIEQGQDTLRYERDVDDRTRELPSWELEVALALFVDPA